ncbi:hypothetical protein [Mesorhizobium sp. B4-1-3]|uniref:hypothetical protein n=1 Tax=Mesorhizobium sp. B4-1-3 TaxID=2589889 RepID=UPI0032B1878B
MRQAIQGIAFWASLSIAGTLAALADPLPAGFVRLADVDPTIRQDIRYAGRENFLRRKVDGYDAPTCILPRRRRRRCPASRKPSPPKA